MKTAVVIGIGSLVSMLLIAGVFFMIYSSHPSAFGGAIPAPVKAEAKIPADSVKNLTKDSLFAEKTPVLPVKKDSIPPAKPAEIKKTEPLKTIVFEDTTDWKSKAKLFDAMSIESASSILQTMNDKEVKQIIPHIKKRNAAKILATFNPDRAARIIR